MIRLANFLPEKVALPVRWAVSVMFADNDHLIREQFQKLRRAKHSRVHAKFKQYDFLQDFDVFDQICLSGGSMNGQLIVPPTKDSYLSAQASEALEQVIEQDLYWSKNLPPVNLEIHGNTTSLNNSHEDFIEINKTFVNAVQDIIDTYCKPCDTVTGC